MSYENNYQVMDVFNAIDDHTGAMLIPARIFVGSSFDGTDPDFGQCQQRVINQEEISYVYHIPDPRMEWPATPQFGAHPNAGEIGVIFAGQFEIDYPDGTKKELGPDDYFVHEKGQPYRFLGADDEPGGTYIVFHGLKDQKIGNVPSTEEGTGYRTGAIADAAPIESAVVAGTDLQTETAGQAAGSTAGQAQKTALPKGVHIRPIATVDDLTAVQIVLDKGAALPFDGWTQLSVPEIIVVQKGELAGIYPDKTYTVTEKFAFYNPANQPHKYLNIGEEKVTLIAAFKAASLDEAGVKTTQTLDFV